MVDLDAFSMDSFRNGLINRLLTSFARQTLTVAEICLRDQASRKVSGFSFSYDPTGRPGRLGEAKTAIASQFS